MDADIVELLNRAYKKEAQLRKRTACPWCHKQLDACNCVQEAVAQHDAAQPDFIGLSESITLDR